MQDENLKNKFYKKIIGIDVLTDLGNRYGFEKYIEDIKANPRDVMVIVADMNNLKKMNDTLGHEYGDMALIEAGSFLKRNLPQAHIYRVGGDEFFIFLEHDIDTKKIDILNNVPIDIKDVSTDIEISFAIGYEKYKAYSKISIDDTINIADKKMYFTKQEYKKRSLEKNDNYDFVSDNAQSY